MTQFLDNDTRIAVLRQRPGMVQRFWTVTREGGMAWVQGGVAR